MQPFDRRQLERIRASSDLREGPVRRFVTEQLQHPDPAIAAAARRVLDGELAVWQLVDLVEEFADLDEGVEAALGLLDAMPPAEREALLAEAGADAASLQALVAPDPGRPSAEAAYYLDQLGARDRVSVDEVNRVFGVDVFGLFLPPGEVGRQRGADEQPREDGQSR